jgi:hypothetical protein
VVYTYLEALRLRVPLLFKRVQWAARLPLKARPVE